MNVLEQRHPVATTHYVIPTRAIEALYDNVHEWVDNRCPGAIVYGTQRMGKSTAIKVLKKGLLHHWPGLFLTNLLCNTHRTPSEGVFFEDLLRGAGHSMFSSGSPSAKRQRLTEFLVEKAEFGGESRVVLFADDAQKLSEIQYNWLMDLHNDLHARDVDLIVLLVGQPQLLDQQRAFKQLKKMQIVGRFMVHATEFKGLRSAEDTGRSLRSYDEESEFPLGSGCSFTQFYFPHAWKEGWRLQSHAQAFWDAFQHCGIEARTGPVREVPMQYFCRTVEHILRRHGDGGAWVDLSDLIFRDAVRRSGLVDALRLG